MPTKHLLLSVFILGFYINNDCYQETLRLNYIVPVSLESRETAIKLFIEQELNKHLTPGFDARLFMYELLKKVDDTPEITLGILSRKVATRLKEQWNDCKKNDNDSCNELETLLKQAWRIYHHFDEQAEKTPEGKALKIYQDQYLPARRKFDDYDSFTKEFSEILSHYSKEKLERKKIKLEKVKNDMLNSL